MGSIFDSSERVSLIRFHAYLANHPGLPGSISPIQPNCGKKEQSTMYKEHLLETTDLTTLAAQCREELRHYASQQPIEGRSCLELLRRATHSHLEEAWVLLLDLLTPPMRVWFRAHPHVSLALAYDSEENYIAQTFSRFWSVVRERRVVFSRLPAFLSYLRLTLHSTIIDTLRSYLRVPCVSLLDPAVSESTYVTLPESDSQDDSWSAIARLLENEQERQLVYLLYYCGLKPREVAARFPLFQDVKAIYRLNHLILERLRRKREQLRWLLCDEEKTCGPQLSEREIVLVR